MSEQEMNYDVDLVLCIDATGSMADTIERVKASALKFAQDIRGAIEARGRVIDNLRVRVIPFRDVAVDGSRALQPSSFFALPQEQEKLAELIGGLSADGGGDRPESGLEALVEAIRSPWSPPRQKLRQVIVLWTDAPAHPTQDLGELHDLWEGQSSPLGDSTKRMVLFAPDEEPWSELSSPESGWDYVAHTKAEPDQGLEDYTYDEIIAFIGQSV